MTYEELKAMKQPVLTFSTQRSAEKANRLISFAMELDQQTTVIFDEVKSAGTKFYITHPVSQCDTQEQLDVLMEYVDNATVVEYDVAWSPA